MSYRSIGQNQFLLRMVSRMRKQRFQVLRGLLGDGSAPTSVLDAGGHSNTDSR